jgi:hypothetical protein
LNAGTKNDAQDWNFRWFLQNSLSLACAPPIFLGSKICDRNCSALTGDETAQQLTTTGFRLLYGADQIRQATCFRFLQSFIFSLALAGEMGAAP